MFGLLARSRPQDACVSSVQTATGNYYLLCCRETSRRHQNIGLRPKAGPRYSVRIRSVVQCRSDLNDKLRLGPQRSINNSKHIMIRFCLSAALFLVSATFAHSADWPQGPGSRFDFTAPESTAPSEFSATLDQNIAWRISLPETGQSAPVILRNRIFVTTMKPVEAESATGSSIVAWCLSAADGSVLWKREIEGSYQTKMSAPFGDASSPAAVTDGKRVWFLNPTGRLACFTLDGALLWSREVTSVVRTRPVLFEGKLILHRQVYLPNESGTFTHDNAHAGVEMWTQLQALDPENGDQIWLSECGVNMGCVPVIQKLSDGTAVLVVGRGGGHGPPEKPAGVSMIRANDGKTV